MTINKTDNQLTALFESFKKDGSPCEEEGVNSAIPNPESPIYHIKLNNTTFYALDSLRNHNDEFANHFIITKYDNPHQLAELMTPVFIKYFDTYKQGHIDLITTAQRSVRNLKHTHPMDIVAVSVSKQLGIEYEPIFEPWNKKYRGFHYRDTNLVLEGNNNLEKYKKKIVFILDDVKTSGHTMTKALHLCYENKIHAHGLVYIVWG